MSKSQNLRKYLTKEDLLQEQILVVCGRCFPEVKAIHIPNEGKRSDFEQLKFKVLGGAGGVSDLFLNFPSHVMSMHKGLWIEVKYGKNKLTPEQLAFLTQMYYFGYAVAVVYDKEEDFKLLVDRLIAHPEQFREGIALAKDAELSFLKFGEAEKRLVKKVSATAQKRDIQAQFEKKAKSRFGTAIPKRSLPNAGKLFRSPRNK